MAKVVAFLSTFFLIFLFIAAIGYTRFFGPAGTLFRRTLDPPAVVQEVKQLNELTTVKYSIQKVVGFTVPHSPFGSESILLLVGARVLAGINLQDVTQYDITMPKKDSVVIRLPLPRITEAFLDEKDTKVWDRRITWWTPWVENDPDLEHQARLQALAQVRAQAVQMGILRDAQRNAEASIRHLLQAFGISNVSFHMAS